MNLFTFNDYENWYEYFDKVNLQLTVYSVEVEGNCVTVLHGRSPILQKNMEMAKSNIVWSKEESIGTEFIKMLNHAITNQNISKN